MSPRYIYENNFNICYFETFFAYGFIYLRSGEWVMVAVKMGNCLRNIVKRLSGKRQGEKSIVLMAVGLDNAGKTLVLNQITDEPDRNVLPTMGFRMLSLKYKSYCVKIYDLGGSSQIRPIWPKYYGDIHGVIYVVDASDISRLTENKIVFGELVSHQHISGKPLLLLANKQDKSGAIDELDLVESLDVERVANAMKCPTRVETCSCICNPEQTKTNTHGIMNGYKWLLDSIHKDYSVLNSRVKEQQNLKQESNSRRRESVADTPSKISVHSNPFVPINDLLTKKTKVISNHASTSHNGVKSGQTRKNIFTLKNKTAPCPPDHSVVDFASTSEIPSFIKTNIGTQKSTQTEELILIPERLMCKQGENESKQVRPYTAPGRSQHTVNKVTVSGIPGQVYY